jgi:hypothetical protein
MTPEALVPRLRYAGLLALIAIALSLALWSHGDRAHATSFAPTYEATVVDATPGANSTVSFAFDIDAPDANFDSLVTFAPAEFTFAGDEAVPDGAVAGTIEADATLGLINGACNSVLTVPFELVDATTDITNPFPLYFGINDQNGDGLVENVTRYPSFLTIIAPGLQPIQRLYGQSLVAGLWVPVNFVIFEPGARIPLFPEFDESLGYPVLVTLLDPTAPIEQSSISDFCSPVLTTTELLGVSEDNPATPEDESGSVLLSNPTEDGHYGWTIFTRGRWDSDDDGIENELDPCPYDPNPDWDPRADGSPGDADGDGLPATCDFDDSTTNADQDGDGWLNRMDLCPTVVNSSSVFLFDADYDGVGDECDRAPDDESDGGLNHRHQVCVTSFVAIGAPGGDPPDDPVCPDGADLPLPPKFSAFVDKPVADVGDAVAVSVRVTDRLSNLGLEGIEVGFEVTGANPAVGVCVTEAFGTCEFGYIGANAGVDTIEAMGSVGAAEFSWSGEVEWVVPPPPPENDDFADAIVISGMPYEYEQQMLGAGREDGEPEGCVGENPSVWFEFTPDADVFIESRVTGAGLAVAYQGDDVAGADQVECLFGQFTDDGGAAEPTGFGEPSGVIGYVWLDAAETYHIQLVSFGGPGALTLALSEGTLGDASCDGALASTDALTVLSRIAFGAAFGCFAGGDMNCDGEWAATDALEILRRIAGLSSKVGCV